MHHSQFDVLEAIRIYLMVHTLTHEYYSKDGNLTHSYKVLKSLALIIYLEQMTSDLLMTTNLEIHLELEIETQVGLLEEMIRFFQLSSLVALNFCMGKSLNSLLAQNHQHTCRTQGKFVLF